MTSRAAYQDPSEQGNRALQLFTDRDKLVRLFAEYLNDDPSRGKIIFFHGDGGNGKSLLLKFLGEKCCKRFLPEVWQELRDIQDNRVFAARVEASGPEDYTRLPSALLNFDHPPMDYDDTKNRFYGLLKLRKLVTEAAEPMCKLQFPLYDFACVSYLFNQGRSSEEIKRLFPLSEIAGLIAPVIDFLNGTTIGTFGKGVIDIFAKGLGEKFNLYMQQRRLTPDQLEEIRNRDPERLVEILPHYFAEDLNAAMKTDKTPRRLVLFFDTHEAFWGGQRDCSKYTYFFQDEWLRQLLKTFDFSHGIMAVVAGREIPRWPEAARFSIPKKDLDTQLVWHLSEKDAGKYLENAGIKEPALRDTLIRFASVKADQVHPFYLGLCADVVSAAREHDNITLQSNDFERIPEISEKSKVLIERLLKYVDQKVEYAIEVLAACRRFDFALYKKLGKALDFDADRPAFNTLIRFSFVWQDKKGGYRIHDLLGRRYNQDRNPVTLRTHAGLEKYYRKQNNITDALYHLICRNRKQGKEELIQTFKQAKAERNLELCQSLLELRTEMSLYLDRSPRK